MDNTLNLIPGQLYAVIKPFEDYDHFIHPVGEKWIYRGTNFLPYEDGLTVHIVMDEINQVYRLQWRLDAQGEIIDHFHSYVEPV